MLNRLKTAIFSASILLAAAACNPFEDVNDGPKVSPNYTLAFTAQGSNDVATDYVLNASSITSGEISAEGTGIEQVGWRYFYPAGNGSTVFTSGFGDDSNLVGYRLDAEGNLVEAGRVAFDATLDIFGTPDENTLLALEVPRGGFVNSRLHIVDVENVAYKDIVELEIFKSEEDSLISYATAVVVRDNKLFIPFQKMDAKGWFTTPETDSAYVAVYSYPELKFEKIISDPRTSPIGSNGHSSGLIKTENGDLYSYSAASLAAGFTQITRPSGILRIQAGETEFDKNYFFNVEEATGKKIFWFDYVGNGKAIARLTTDENATPWSAFLNGKLELAVIDLENQTVTMVQGAPVHACRYTSKVLVEDGKAYVNVETAEEANIYEVDIEKATATKGATIKGQGVKGIFRLNLPAQEN
jgi:hypothetical protein